MNDSLVSTMFCQDEKKIFQGVAFVSKKNNTWTFGKLINFGSYGTIFQEAKNKDLVIKVGGADVYFEIAVLRKLSNPLVPSIPTVVDSGKLFSVKPDSYFIIMPNYGVSLYSMIVKDPLKINETSAMAVDILSALNYMSSKQYMHLDVTPNNIVYSRKNKSWCLIDFGLAKNFRKYKFEKDKNYINHGTKSFMARDAHRGIMSRKCDLESLSYVILISRCITLPWINQKNKTTVFRLKNKFFTNENILTLDIPENYKAFMIDVNALNPEDTPDYQEYQALF